MSGISKSGRRWVRGGYCCRCGDCCRAITTKYMLDEKKGYCKHLTFESENRKTMAVCGIAAGQFGDDVLVKPLNVSEREFNYWLKCCKPYPRDGDFGHHLPPNCTYYQIWVT